jgi:hypothetical protein
LVLWHYWRAEAVGACGRSRVLCQKLHHTFEETPHRGWYLYSSIFTIAYYRWTQVKRGIGELHQKLDYQSVSMGINFHITSSTQSINRACDPRTSCPPSLPQALTLRSIRSAGLDGSIHRLVVTVGGGAVGGTRSSTIRAIRDAVVGAGSVAGSLLLTAS